MHITVSLKDALRRRPGAPEGSSKWKGSSIPMIRYQTSDAVICKPMWTAAEFRTFEHLSDMVCSAHQPERVRARAWLKAFQEKHGMPKCQMMLAELRRRDEQAWFDKQKGKGS